MKRLVIVALRTVMAAAGVIVATTSVQAYDLTGTWEGTYTCKGLANGVKDAYVNQLVAKISQVGTAVGADITFDGTPFKYNGIAAAKADKPDKGDLAFVLCGTDDDLSTGVYDEFGRFSVTTKPAKGTGAIKGLSQFSTPEPAVITCKWKLKRTDPADPAVTPACPP